ncbi:PIN domain nuclease [Sphingomonas sp.]|uniref:type II toxin-antitoxin system VapC family toxin n=1 Tax=Sphingomonas sp. TaxID=28214 RepID=UPI0035BC36EF
MIVADSSVWIDFFRNTPTAPVRRLEAAIERDEVLIGDLIRAEVLQGCRTDREFEHVLNVTGSFPALLISDEQVAVQSARNYRTLRARGITIRKTIDALIATRCILDDTPLLYTDRDFDPFVQHLGLRSALDPPGVT